MKPDEGYCNLVSFSYRHCSFFDHSDPPWDIR
jgi:hypothetical protein